MALPYLSGHRGQLWGRGFIPQKREEGRLKRPTIILQNIDGSHNRYITSRERDELLNKSPGDVRRITRRKDPRQIYRLIPHPVAKRSMHEASPPSITGRETLINAGVGGRFGETVSRGQINRVRAKVAAFDDGRSKRSPVIVCGLLTV